MPEKFKVVLDTNIFVSALLGSPVCSDIWDALIERRFLVVVSKPLMQEISEVLFDRGLTDISNDDADRLFKALVGSSESIEPKELITICRDPEDNKILELAVGSNADFIVTGDKDLLVLKRFRNTSIVTPKEFFSLLNKR